MTDDREQKTEYLGLLSEVGSLKSLVDHLAYNSCMKFIALAALLSIGAAHSPVAPGDDEMTDRQKRSIEKATNWILQAQNRDGSWGLDRSSAGDVTCTALAGLALMTAGNTERSGPDARSVE